MTDMHILVRVVGHGYGIMEPRVWLALRDHPNVETLAFCPTEEKAKWLFHHLPQAWRGARIEEMAWEFVGEGA